MNAGTRRTIWGLLTGGVLFFGLLGGRADLWSSSVKPTPQSGLISSAQAAPGSEAETLQSAFIRISQQVGPAVVSISTEQLERVKQYFRVHPFFGNEPFEDFFRQFYGDVPEQEFRRFGLGSGVIIDERGFVLTNEHVVADAEKITVTMSDGRELVGTVKGKDPRSDLAVVKIEGTHLPTAVLGDSSGLKTGQWAVALGNPFGLMGVGPSAHALGSEPTLTVGVISALNRQLPRASRSDRDYSGLIQTDAAINPGNSGGPLLNLQGDIIGINVAILTSSRGFEGIGFAIPVNKAKNVLSALIEGKTVVYGWLGIRVQDITDDVAEYYGLSDREGILVYQVLPDSPASASGMRDGDIVKTFEGQPIHNSRELIDHVSAAKAGRRVSIDVLRDGRRQTFQVQIGERPAEPELEGAATTEAWRGLQVGNLSAEQLERLNLPADTTGVVAVDVAGGSPAEQAGLRPGDIINEINRMRIENANDYRSAIAKVKGNALVRTNRGYVVIKAGG
ncbi:MAG: Do family serine endopeptidase [Candidatus Omnitrophica bacterium]|nr:Do family serine endopeptidase [Candidatus Omnitrophota bacterium]